MYFFTYAGNNISKTEENIMTPDMYDYEKVPVTSSLDENISNIENILGKSSDLLSNPFFINGIPCDLLCFEGLISTQTITDLILVPLTGLYNGKINSPQKLFEHIKNNMLMTIDRGMPVEYGDLIRRLMSGFAVLLIDGIDTAIAFGVQGYATRSISEPSSEGNIRGSHEGFVETVRTNMSLVRRRLKSPLLRFELFPVTRTSKADVILSYMADRVPMDLVKKIRKQLEELPLESVLGSGYIEPFLNNTKKTVFSGVSVTERPDVFCAKILEGRIGLLIAGTPFAIVIPSLFVENFQTFLCFPDKMDKIPCVFPCSIPARGICGYSNVSSGAFQSHAAGNISFGGTDRAAAYRAGSLHCADILRNNPRSGSTPSQKRRRSGIYSGRTYNRRRSRIGRDNIQSPAACLCNIGNGVICDTVP